MSWSRTIERIKANRMEGSIFVEIEAMMSNSRSKLVETHVVSGSRLEVTLEEEQPTGIGTLVTGIGRIQFRVLGDEANIDAIDYVDVYYAGNSKTATVS